MFVSLLIAGDFQPASLYKIESGSIFLRENGLFKFIAVMSGEVRFLKFSRDGKDEIEGVFHGVFEDGRGDISGRFKGMPTLYDYSPQPGGEV